MLDSERTFKDAKVEKKAQAIQEISPNEVKKLRTIGATKGTLSNSEWARLLGYDSKQGAYSFLDKMEV